MNIDKIFKQPDFLKDYGNGILLNNKELSLLKQYDIDPKNYKSLKNLIFDIEKILEYEDLEELDQLLIDISERDYYMNNK